MARIMIFSPNEVAAERCKELLSPLGHEIIFHPAVINEFSFKWVQEDALEEREEILTLLSTWIKDIKSVREPSGLGVKGVYLINLPFEDTTSVPLLPRKKEYRTEEGFLTNPNNWDKGLNLL